MARASKSTAQKADSYAVHEPAALCLTLSPAELEALLERLCCCGTLRARLAAPRLTSAPRCVAGRGCTRRARDQWCRAGARVTAGQRAETKFG